MKKLLSAFLFSTILISILTSCNNEVKTAETKVERLTINEVAQGFKEQGIILDTLDLAEDEDQTHLGRTSYTVKLPVEGEEEVIKVKCTIEDATNLSYSLSIWYYNHERVESELGNIQKLAKKMIRVIDKSLSESEIDTIIRDLAWQEESKKQNKNGAEYYGSKSNIAISFSAYFEESSKLTGENRIAIDKDKFEDNLIKEGLLAGKGAVDQDDTYTNADGARYTFAFKSGGYKYTFSYSVSKKDNVVTGLSVSSKETYYIADTEQIVRKTIAATQLNLSESEITEIINWLFYSKKEKSRYKSANKGDTFFSGSSSKYEGIDISVEFIISTFQE